MKLIILSKDDWKMLQNASENLNGPTENPTIGINGKWNTKHLPKANGLSNFSIISQHYSAPKKYSEYWNMQLLLSN